MKKRFNRSSDCYTGWRTLRAGYQNHTEWWVSIKERAGPFFQQAGRRQAWFRRRHHEYLNYKLQSLHKQVAWSWDMREAMWEVKAQIRALYREQARQKVFLDQSHWVETGKKWFGKPRGRL